MNVFARGIDLQPTDLLPIPPTVVRDQHQVIIESLKHSIGHAAVKLDNRADLTIKVNFELTSRHVGQMQKLLSYAFHHR